MTPPPPEQRNPYKGLDPRPWVRASLVAADGTSEELELVADTGNPFFVVVDGVTMTQRKLADGPLEASNFGPMIGGALRVVIPEIGFDRQLMGFANDNIVRVLQAESPDFAGLVELPFLRLMEYGGDATDFWIRPAGTAP
jgi:hypothetical protein